MYILNIALDVPLNQVFSYTSSKDLLIGTRVVVNFHSRKMVGVVWDKVDSNSKIKYDQTKLKSILEVLPEVLDLQIIQLAKFISVYYHCPIGQAIFVGLPSLIRKPQLLNWSKPHVFILTQLGLSKLIHLRSKKQQQLFQMLQNTSLTSTQIKAFIGPTYLKLIKNWSENGLIEKSDLLPDLKNSAIPLLDKSVILNHEQQYVVDELTKHFNSFYPCLLYGITGSGKTEVYLELIQRVIHQGQQVLILVPEINLTPQLLARFNNRFPNINIHSLTSSSSEKERLNGYLESQLGNAQIVIGTRLSVFTPFKSLGIIIVDEEHDHSFKQNDGIRYNARDIAIWRGAKLNIPVVLGSATPSLESLYNFKLGKYKLYKLSQRAVDSSILPQIKLIDLNAYSKQDGLTEIALAEINKRLDNQEISLVFINRRGYSPVISCYECGWVSGCSNCSTTMVYHSSTKNLKCHHCGLVKELPKHCPICNNVYLQALGHGTQKIESVLKNKFPNARIHRIDQDTIQSKNEWNNLYQKIHDGEVDILVGTQMLSKGHDFHNITLVVGVNIDSGLYGYDFRSSELLFRQLIQVSGRAGRGKKEGMVLLQTNYPNHDLYQYLIKHDFSGFANYLLLERKQLCLPPYSHQALLRVMGPNLDEVLNFLGKIYELSLKFKPTVIQLGSPVTSLIQRLKNKERAQLLIYSNNREQLHKFLDILELNINGLKVKSTVNWYLDIDPIEL